MNIDVIPNDNPKECEDSRGRVRVANRRTWFVVVDGQVYAEEERRSDAVRLAERLTEAARD